MRIKITIIPTEFKHKEWVKTKLFTSWIVAEFRDKFDMKLVLIKR